MSDGVLLRDFGAAWVSGWLSTTIGFPFDCVKTTSQITGRSALQSFYSIIKGPQGVLGLFAGLMSPLISSPLMLSFNMGVYTHTSRLLGGRDWEKEDSFLVHAGAGFCAGSLQSFLSTPFELVKTRMQLAQSSQSTLQYARSIYRDRGLRGFYAGHTLLANAVVLSFGSAVFFTTHSFLSQRCRMFFGQNPNDSLTTQQRLLVGGTTGSFYWMCVFGLDSLRTRLILDAASPPGQGQFKGMWHCAKVVVKTYGWRKGLYAGLGPALVRSFPTNATFMTVFSLLTSSKQ